MTLEIVRAAAALADPVRSAPWAGLHHGVDPEQVVEVLRANKVPLLEIAGGDLERSGAWLEAAAHEKRQRDALAGEFADVAATLASRDITPVLFKSAGGLPYRSSNLDLLVRPSDAAPAAELLERTGHLRLPHYREDHKLLFRRFRKGRSVICIHLHEAVSWGKVLILPGDEVVERSLRPRTGESGFRVASSGDLLLITLAHSLYETDQIRLSDVRTLRLCATDTTLDWPRVIDRVRRRGWCTGFFSVLSIIDGLESTLYGATTVPAEVIGQARAALDRARWARAYVNALTARFAAATPAGLPYRLSRGWSKLHMAAMLMSQPGRSPDERLADLAATATNLLANRLKLRCRPAVLVSLSGLEGAGKSSTVRALHEAMTLCEIPTRAIWSRGGFTAPLKTAKRVARTIMGDWMPGPAESDQKRRWLSGRLTGPAFATLVVAEQAIHYVLRVRIPLWLGRSILCDRYSYDVMADLAAKLGAGRGLSLRAGELVLGVARQPDLAILLRLEPEEAARRKPGEAPLPMLVEQAAVLDRVAAMCGLSVIDAARPEDEVIAEVVELTLRMAFTRFSGALP